MGHQASEGLVCRRLHLGGCGRKLRLPLCPGVAYCGGGGGGGGGVVGKSVGVVEVGGGGGGGGGGSRGATGGPILIWINDDAPSTSG